MGEPVFLTGGSGFVGGALLERLLTEGRAVRALTRSPAAAERLRAQGAEPVLGDVLDLEGLGRAMRGAGLVFHAAGVNAFCPADPGPMFRANVEGSANVVRAAAVTGVARVVYTSSAATLGEATGTVGDEAAVHRGWFLSAYERSKYEAERRVLEMAATLGVDVVCVNPSSVQGPGRTRGTARWLIRYANGQLGWMVDTQVSLVDIADCTAGHLLAAGAGVAGSRYVLNGATLPVRRLLRVVEEVSGQVHPVRWVPGPVALAGAAMVEAAFRLRRRRPPVCREMMRTLLHGHRYDGSRATRDLGLAYTPV
ncbi:MAG TPA: NAD-dependent epimerase/dehydratase family protein, partial [Candidatus Dormibacteraeota bacterium]|nr:NAD-dependent epimerase/dehydratase family protein [Candidatus Dormibacteraeota bacterium]